MTHSHHYLAGLPEWADDDTAADTVAAMGLALNTPPSTQDNDDNNGALRRLNWRLAAAFYWLTAADALAGNQWPAMRQAAKQARDCETKADPMLNAVFGPSGYAPENIVAQGADLAPPSVAAARRAVHHALAHHDRVTQQQARDRQQAQKQAQAHADAKKDQAISHAVQQSLTLGKIYPASRPYKLAKKSDNLCSVNGVRVFVKGVSDGARVQISAFSHGKAYGLQYEAVGVLA